VELDGAWRRALEQRGRAFSRGTTPVGAVVADSAGDAVTGGRGMPHWPHHVAAQPVDVRGARALSFPCRSSHGTL
jgi:hypothetical protein